MEKEPKIETREVMKLPEIEIKSEKGLFLLSVLGKGYNPEWGNQDKKCVLVKETEKYFEKNPLNAESIEYLKSIKAFEQDGVDEESLFYLSMMYKHPERDSETLARDKLISKDGVEELKNGLFKIFEKLENSLSSNKLAKDFEKATEGDIEKRQEKLPETRKMLQEVINFLRPSPETTKVKKAIFVPTNYLWRQESGRFTEFGDEFVISENVDIQDSNPHEFMHSIINPITEKLRGRLTEEQKQKIVKMSPEMLKGKMDYGEHWYSLFNESLIRTYIDYFSKGENPGFESFRKKIDQIKDEDDFQEKAENWDTRTKEVTEKLGIRTFVDLKEKLQQYFDMEVKNELAGRVCDFYQKYAEVQKSDPNLNFEDYLQQNYEELVK